MTTTARLFDPPESDVIEHANCTWCGAAAGEGCRPPEGRRSTWDLPGGPGTAHAARWVDLWNLRNPSDPKPVARRGAPR